MINSVLKAIRILRLFSATEPRLSLAEISRKLEMPKSTAHNLLKTLLAEGFIERVDQYALGTAALTLTQAIRVNVEIRDPAAPLLRSLADASGESAYLTVREGDYVLYIYAVESPRRLMARTAVGERVHMHCTAVGKAVLAHLDDEELTAVLARTGLPSFTAATMTDHTVLCQALDTVRQQGFSLDCGEHEEGTYCIGVPICDGKGTVLGACRISGLDGEIVHGRRPELSELVVSAAQQISRHMGYVPSRLSGVNELAWNQRRRDGSS